MPSQKLLAARKRVFDSIGTKNKVSPDSSDLNETDNLIESKTLQENFEDLKTNYKSLKEKMKLIANMGKTKSN